MYGDLVMASSPVIALGPPSPRFVLSACSDDYLGCLMTRDALPKAFAGVFRGIAYLQGRACYRLGRAGTYYIAAQLGRSSDEDNLTHRPDEIGWG